MSLDGASERHGNYLITFSTARYQFVTKVLNGCKAKKARLVKAGAEKTLSCVAARRSRRSSGNRPRLNPGPAWGWSKPLRGGNHGGDDSGGILPRPSPPDERCAVIAVRTELSSLFLKEAAGAARRHT